MPGEELMGNRRKVIVVEGTPRTSKKQFARLLARELNYHFVGEPVPDSGILKSFYRGGDRYTLATELYFLVSRFKQLGQAMEQDLFSPSDTVLSFMIEKSRIYASMTLSDEEQKIYDSIYPMLSTTGVKPDLIVYLYAEPSIILRAVRNSPITGEEFMTREYLDSLIEAYHSFFYRYTACPVVFFDVSEIPGWNGENQDVAKDMIRFIDRLKPGSNFYVPRLAAP
ncbi:MAG: hypothetical protein CO090_04785 [Acidobacteria bacterium CG_4_9_14_3_um_filter_49_7]|nr:MAG: hypothetical protein CO090_04785 [Acidobacteria bacterium CG_4_9_14_3_um_filter_49_7]